ncbi:dual specificity protein phosphatase 13A-like isoform X2 [Siphateles boraxobius]|uniref:dual specificity protein phosphatase 13A-like isoform X2 n=1 Tax=Siphateles boraxobius TaxID=180520 RepID=UPI004062AC9E
MDDICETPSIRELEKVLFGGKRSGNHADEVWPNLFLGDMSVANDRFSLWKSGITRVLNAAHGQMHCQGSHQFYGSKVEYYGVGAEDSPSFNLSVYFHPCADYIKEVLGSPGVFYIKYTQFSGLCCRTCFGSLCGGSESLGLSGSGLSHDTPEAFPTGRY